MTSHSVSYMSFVFVDDVKKLQSRNKKYTSEAEEAFLRHAR